VVESGVLAAARTPSLPTATLDVHGREIIEGELLDDEEDEP
jgi:hypothetical protein